MSWLCLAEEIPYSSIEELQGREPEQPQGSNMCLVCMGQMCVLGWGGSSALDLSDVWRGGAHDGEPATLGHGHQTGKTAYILYPYSNP